MYSSRNNGTIVADKHRTSDGGSAKPGKMSVADVERGSLLFSFFLFFLLSHLTAKFVRWMILHKESVMKCTELLGRSLLFVVADKVLISRSQAMRLMLIYIVIWSRCALKAKHIVLNFRL